MGGLPCGEFCTRHHADPSRLALLLVGRVPRGMLLSSRLAVRALRRAAAHGTNRMKP